MVNQTDRDAADALHRKLYDLTGTLLLGDDVRELFYQSFAYHRLVHQRKIEIMREALIHADLKIRSISGADQSDVEFIRGCLA